MSDQAAADSAVSERATRPAWLPLAAAAVVVPTVLAGLTLLWPRLQIETELTRTGTEALAAAGFPGAALSLDGRDATITGIPAGADRQRAIDAVQAVTGVRVAAFPAPGSGGGGGNGGGAPAVAAQPFGIARQGDNLVLTGVVGSDDQRAQLVAAATAQAAGRGVVDQLTVTPGAPLPAGVDGTSVGAAAAAVAAGTGSAAVSIAPSGVTLSGAVADEAAKAAAAKAVAAALPGATVDDQLTVAAATATGGDLDAATKQQLQSSISALLAGAPIAFEPDSPQLTPQGSGTVATVLDLLKAAPGARVEVDGFVAPGKGNGKLTAQQLSDQRAGTVRDALVAGGVAADHITAAGKGEGPARRVVITVV